MQLCKARGHTVILVSESSGTILIENLPLRMPPRLGLLHWRVAPAPQLLADRLRDVRRAPPSEFHRPRVMAKGKLPREDKPETDPEPLKGMMAMAPCASDMAHGPAGVSVKPFKNTTKQYDEVSTPRRSHIPGLSLVAALVCMAALLSLLLLSRD